MLQGTPWQLLSASDYTGLAKLLSSMNEWEYSALTDRLLRPLKSCQVWIHSPDAGQGPDGVILQEKSGYTFPWFDTEFRKQQNASLPNLGYKPSTIMGMNENLQLFLSMTEIQPREYIPYFLMHRTPSPLLSRTPREIQLIQLRPAHFSDLLPLERGYQREEVLLPGHVLHQETIEKNLRYILRRHIGFGVWSKGRFMAKAHTNARGINCCQIGGVYTLPELRGQGFAAYALQGLMKNLGAELHSTSLFVKPGNTSGIALYRKLGFSHAGGYAIAYV